MRIVSVIRLVFIRAPARHPLSRPAQRSSLGGSPVQLDGALLGPIIIIIIRIDSKLRLPYLTRSGQPTEAGI